ncbi:maleylpyruvate isomerase family mycothiol-dependent enzyme [Streptomyces sp. NPDC045251]|uniref:maleylpyruvate isomerase family mycothiol-dependent enzyme n=1 Tax=unclassified Streptomyces TaxID=2593676 RepID=UPI0033D06BC0
MTVTDGTPEPAERLAEIEATHKRLRARTALLGEAGVRAPSTLPGWSRAHVLTHLGDLARAFARQALCALDGRVVEVYDGGRPARDAAIERGAPRSVELQLASLEDGVTQLEQAWALLGPGDWDRPCGYRGATLEATQLCWWREVHLHFTDLDLGYRAEEWSDALARHVVGHLLPRLPADRTTVLYSDGDRWEHGAGAPTTVHGTRQGLAAWISGRPTAREPKAYGAHNSLPELGSWP